MSVHPLSLRKQLLYRFHKVQMVRFEFKGYSQIFRALLKDGTSGHLDSELQIYLKDHQAMGTHTLLSEWQDGPPWPDEFNALSEEQRVLVEACDSTANSVEAVVVQAFDEITAAKCETLAAGAVKVTIQTRNTKPDSRQINAYKHFIIACIPAPGVGVEVVVGPVEVEPKPKFNLPFIANQASREGITDRELLIRAEIDEDMFRDLRRRGFPTSTTDCISPELAGKSTVYFPLVGAAIDIRMFLPLYDAVYAPIEALIKDTQIIYGVPRQDILTLIESRRIVPVITKRLGDYDQIRLREIIDMGLSVTPRVLTAGVTTQLFAANPLWRLAQVDPHLPKEHIDIIRTGIICEPCVPKPIRDFVNRWIEYQISGCIDLGTGYINDVGMLPFRLGPGAFLADVLNDVHGEKSPDLEARIIGTEVCNSMALNATCVPMYKEVLYPLYDLLCLFSGAREARPGDRVLQRLSVVAQADEILKQLRLDCPSGMPVTEWIDVAGPCMDALRNSLTRSLRGKAETLQEVKEAADKLEKDIERLVKGTARTGRSVETFEVIGLVSDSIAWAANSTFPYSGTVIGVVLKRVFPKIWYLLEKNKATQQMRDALEAANSLVPPHVVRLHRAKNKLKIE